MLIVYNDCMETNIFGKRLKELRVQSDLTQDKLANILSIHQTTISFWEIGTRDEPGMSSLIALANYFDVSIDYLVGRTDDY